MYFILNLKELDDIKKNRALEENQEMFSFRDKNFLKNNLNEKENFNISNTNIQKVIDNSKNVEKIQEDEITEKVNIF